MSGKRMRNLFKSDISFPEWALVLPIMLVILSRFIFFSALEPDAETVKNSRSVPLYSQDAISGQVRHSIDIIKEIPQDSHVLILVNYGPEARFELEPALSLLITHLAQKNVSISFVSMAPTGIESSFLASERAIEQGNIGKDNFLYNRNYTHLGYAVGDSIASYMVANDFSDFAERDIFNASTKKQLAMEKIDDLSDYSMIFEFSSRTFDGVPAIVALSFFSSSPIKKTAFCTTDIVPAYIPFNGIYLDGFIGGYKSISQFKNQIRPSEFESNSDKIFRWSLIYILVLVLVSSLTSFVRGRK